MGAVDHEVGTVADKVVVVYDWGAASPWEIATGLAEFNRIEFVVAESDHATAVLPVLRDLGHVVPLREWSATAWGGDSPSAILTFSERMLRTTAELAAALDLPFHSPAVAAGLTDKLRQRERLARAGVETVAHRGVSSLADWPTAVAHVGLPAVLKPTRGEGSRHTHLITDESRGRDIAAALLLDGSGELNLILEEYLQGHGAGPFGDYVSVESVVSRGKVSHLELTGKFALAEPFRETGQFWPACLGAGECEAVTALAEQALLALDVQYGITHTEVKLTAAGPRIIEVNGRLGGHINELASRATGIDVIRLAGRAALGSPVAVEPPPLSGVYFQYNNPAPTEPCRLERVVGRHDVTRVPEIDAYRLYAKPGTELSAGVGTAMLDLICGRAKDHHHMVNVVDDALDRLSFVFSNARGEFTRSAVSLRGPSPSAEVLVSDRL